MANNYYIQYYLKDGCWTIYVRDNVRYIVEADFAADNSELKAIITSFQEKYNTSEIMEGY